MKKFTISLVSVVILAVLTLGARADLVTEYGVNINDTNPYLDNVNLYQLFNDYFADQL